jgi:hypothetical protein
MTEHLHPIQPPSKLLAADQRMQAVQQLQTACSLLDRLSFAKNMLYDKVMQTDQLWLLSLLCVVAFYVHTMLWTLSEYN